MKEERGFWIAIIVLMGFLGGLLLDRTERAAKAQGKLELSYDLGKAEGQLIKLREWKNIAYPERVVIPDLSEHEVDQ